MVSVLAADFIAANFNSATNASFSSESRSVSHVYIIGREFFVAHRARRACCAASAAAADDSHGSTAPLA
jgi:hypothetical protein